MPQHKPFTYKQAWKLAENLREDQNIVEVYRDSTSKEYVVHVTGKVIQHQPDPSTDIDKI